MTIRRRLLSEGIVHRVRQRIVVALPDGAMGPMTMWRRLLAPLARRIAGGDRSQTGRCLGKFGRWFLRYGRGRRRFWRGDGWRRRGLLLIRLLLLLLGFFQALWGGRRRCPSFFMRARALHTTFGWWLIEHHLDLWFTASRRSMHGMMLREQKRQNCRVNTGRNTERNDRSRLDDGLWPHHWRQNRANGCCRRNVIPQSGTETGWRMSRRSGRARSAREQFGFAAS